MITLYGNSLHGVSLGWAWDDPSMCAPGDKPSNFGPGCTSGIIGNALCDEGQVYDYTTYKCVPKVDPPSNFCQSGYRPAAGGGCEKIPSTSTSSKPSTSYSKPSVSTTPATPDVPVDSGIPWEKVLAAGLVLSAVGLVVAKKKGYLRNEYGSY